MKFLNKVTVAVTALLVFSCNLTNLDYLDNPNEVSPENAGIDFLYNNIQLNFENFYSTANFRGDGPARMVQASEGFTYNDYTSPSTWNGIWNNAYATLFPDIQALIALADDGGLDVHAGSALIMQSYVLTTLVDFFGDVPWSEALQGTDIISPARDPGASVYAAAETMLDDAIARLTGTLAAKPANDFFYAGDADKWITLANTLKLRIYNNTRLVDSGAGAKMQAIITAGDIIDTPGEDFVFQFGNQRSNPNSRHPFYNNSYETNDGQYMHNYYMWLLHSEKRDAAGDPLQPQDPRLRFYFYRQELDLSDEDPNIYSCERSNIPDLVTGGNFRPASYIAVDADMPYCIVSLDGYYGRDHMNGSGIPPDGPIRSVYGLYPGGGLFDDNGKEFTQASGTLGGLGEGIWPIMTSSFVYFIRAEAAEAGLTSDDPRVMLEMGIRHSMAKVRTFEKFIDFGKQVGTDPSTGDPISLETTYIDPLDQDIEDYVANVLAMYDNPPNYTIPSDRMDVIMKEYLIALFGNGLEGYNNYRRTARPLNTQPGIDIGVGQYAWSAWYPADHVNLNANAEQRAAVIDQPFMFAPMDVSSVR